MDKKTIKTHVPGQKHQGKTDWARVILTKKQEVPDEENPELAFKKIFKKPKKS